MIVYKNVIKAIIKKIRTEFGENTEVVTEDIEECINRPTFLISLNNIKTVNFNDISSDTTLTIEIVYFPKNMKNNRIELLDVTNGLNNIFVKDNVLSIETDSSNYNTEVNSDVDISIITKILHYSFDIPLYENYNRVDNSEYMEDLSYNN